MTESKLGGYVFNKQLQTYCKRKKLTFAGFERDLNVLYMFNQYN